MKFHIWCNGEYSVGIPGAQCTIDWSELSEDENNKEQKEYIEFVREELRVAFTRIFDNRRTFVFTGNEFDEYTKSED